VATIAEELAKLAVTDNLNRNENPLAGEWVLLKPGKQKGKCVSGEGWTPISLFSEGADGAYWKKTGALVGGSGYAASLFLLTQLPGPTAPNRYIGVWVYRDKTTPETKENGYYLRVEYLSGEGATVALKLKLEKWVNGVVTVLKEVETTAGKYKKESRFALVVGGGKVYCFASKEKASAFEQVLEVEDATYTEGYSGLLGSGTGTEAMQNFATGTFNLEEEAGVHKPNSATVNVSAPTPEISAAIAPGSATVNASVPSVELASGPAASPTSDQRHGLPLPFPSVLANPGRLGPPRFNASDRKTLRIKR